MISKPPNKYDVIPSNGIKKNLYTITKTPNAI